MKQTDIQIDAIEAAIGRCGAKFTLAQLQKVLGNPSAALRSRLYRLLDGDERFFNSGDRYFRRAEFFTGRKFLITPDDWEISQGVLFPGHRFLPMLSPEVFPSEVKFGAAPEREISLPLGQAFHYHLLLGSEQIFDFFVADDPANNHLRSHRSGNENVTLHVFDLQEFYREHDFAFGDALLCTVRDYASGVVEFQYLSGEQRSARQLRENVAIFDRALIEVCDRFERYPDIPEQLAWGVFFGAEKELDTTAFSLDEYIHNAVRISIDSEGDHAVLVEVKLPTEAETEIPEDISISRGDVSGLGAILRSIGSTYTETEMEGFLRDAIYSRAADFEVLFNRFFGGAEFADEAQEAVLYNLLADKFEVLQENYNRADDENKAPLRADILEAAENRQEFFTALAESGHDPAKIEHDLFHQCAAVALRLDQALKQLNDEHYTPEGAELEAFASDLDNDLDQMDMVLEKLNQAMERMDK